VQYSAILGGSQTRPFIIRQAAVSITPNGWRVVNDAARQPHGKAAAAFAIAQRVPEDLPKAVNGVARSYALERLPGLEYKKNV
jgi:hypothetical protein